MNLHQLLDWEYGSDGDEVLRRLLRSGADPNQRHGKLAETPLHVATRRRRADALEILLGQGADIDSRTAGGKTAYAHAVRRGFGEVAELLRRYGADRELNEADRLAVAIVNGQLDSARAILKAHPASARTGNLEEDRLLADVTGRNDIRPVDLLISAGADLTAPGLDSGTPLHQAAWFGQPDNARRLLGAGAPLDVFDAVHHSSPIGWAVHGSRYSGGAESRQDAYLEIAGLLLEAGSRLHYPGASEDDAYLERLREDASPAVRDVLTGRSAR
ncbi:MAG: ankyrin repeat domain-containing protein [Thermoanaerobaculia bacterium]|nr:ankyrin repeat domain-containing protein [Thermoanaerobaculia bacterium]